MKKFVVLTLLLAMASLATAGLEVVAPDDIKLGESAAIGLDGADIFGILVAVEVVDSDAVLDFSGIEFPTAFDLPGKAQGVGPKYGEVTISNIFGGPKTGAMLANLIVDATAATTEGMVVVTALQGTSEGGFGATPILGVLAEIPIVPEPMTFALLGLGGLFLRRRK